MKPREWYFVAQSLACALAIVDTAWLERMAKERRAHGDTEIADMMDAEVDFARRSRQYGFNEAMAQDDERDRAA